jgi:hypothetical protein
MPMRIKDVSLYTVHDVAYRLGIAEGTVRKYLRDGKMIGRKHAGAWHVSEESFRVFLRDQGDDLGPEDVPEIVIQVPILQTETGDEIDDELAEDSIEGDEPFPRPCPPGMDDLQWLILEARRLKERAHRLESKYQTRTIHRAKSPD